MKVTLHPSAVTDIEEAAAFYQREGSPALAARFIAEFRRVTDRLIEHPELGSPRPRGRRGLSMSILPYSVIYRVHTDEIRILVVKHDRRRPAHGDERG